MDLEDKKDELEFVDLVFEYAMEYYIYHKVDLTEFICYVAQCNGMILDENKVRETLISGELVIN